MQPIQEFYPLLQKPSRIVITMHQKPDGDAMGSALGLYNFLIQLHHTVTVISPTNWAGFLEWMPGVDTVVDFEKDKENAIRILSETDILFCLDFNVLHRTKNLAPELEKLNCIKVLIDHHEQPQTEVFNYGVSITAKSSTAEMVYDFIADSGNGNYINKEVAQCLYAGMMTDTGSFRFPSTSGSVHLAIARLKETGFEHWKVHENIYDSSPETRLRFIGHVLLNRMEVMYEYNVALMYVPKFDLLKFGIKTGDTEGLVNYLLSIKGIKVGAIVIDRDEERKWSFRSKGNIDVNAFARKYFEGGGHKNAAGGRSSDTLENTVKLFKEIIKNNPQELQ